MYMYIEICPTVQKLVYQRTKGACPFIAYCVTEFETVHCISRSHILAIFGFPANITK